MLTEGMLGLLRLQFLLFGDSIIEQSFRPGGWGAALSDTYSRKYLNPPSIKKPQSEPLYPSNRLAPPIKKPKSVLVGTDLKRFMDESVINMSDLLQSNDLMQLTYQDQLYRHQERFML